MWKTFAEKLALPILATLIGAALVAYFVSERKADLILENLRIADASSEGVNGLGSWYAGSVSSQQRDKLAPIYVRLARTSDDSAGPGTDDWAMALDQVWGSEPSSVRSQGSSALKHCTGLGEQSLRPVSTPPIYPPPGYDSTSVANHPLFGQASKTNSLGVSLYTIDWSLDNSFAKTDAEIISEIRLPTAYRYPSELSDLDPEYAPASFSLQSSNANERCSALRYALMERLIAYSEDRPFWQVKGPLLDLTIRNSGRQSATITGIIATPVWYFAYDCGPGGSVLKPIVAPITLSVDAEDPRKSALEDPVQLEGGSSTRFQVLLDVSGAERACGTRVVFDVEIEYFDGSKSKSMFIGRFGMATMVGEPV